MSTKDQLLTNYQDRIAQGEKSFIEKRAPMQIKQGVSKSTSSPTSYQSEYTGSSSYLNDDAIEQKKDAIKKELGLLGKNSDDKLLSVLLNTGGGLLGELLKDDKVSKANRELTQSQIDLTKARTAEIDANLKYKATGRY